MDLSLSWKISQMALGALAALDAMTYLNDKSFRIAGAQGEVREQLERHGIGGHAAHEPGVDRDPEAGSG